MKSNDKNRHTYLGNRTEEKNKHKNFSTRNLDDELQNLTLKEQDFFKRFCFGPKVELPFKCIHHAFEFYAETISENIAISHLEETITYTELNSQANELAKILIKNNVKKGDNVGVFLKRSIPMLIGVLAVLKIGAAYVAQHIGKVLEEQLKHVVEAASIKVVLTLSDFKDQIPEIDPYRYIYVDEVKKQPYKFPTSVGTLFIPTIPVESKDKAFILFTLGGSGTINGVQVSHRNICNTLLRASGNSGMRPKLKVGQILYATLDMAVWEILGCLANGASLVIRDMNIQKTVEKANVTVYTPTILSTPDMEKSKNANIVTVTEEQCPEYLANKWNRFCAFYNSYGETKNTIVNTAQRYSLLDEYLTIGRPTPNNTVYILDKNKQPSVIGEIGEMWVGGDCVTLGYIDNEQLSEERYVLDPFIGMGNKMFRTRNLGRWTVNGELEHLGRIDD